MLYARLLPNACLEKFAAVYQEDHDAAGTSAMQKSLMTMSICA